MIDRQEQVGRLMERLGQALPIPARPTPELKATLKGQHSTFLTTDCRVTWISYADEEGGIVCKLEAGCDLAGGAVFTSITHLRFDPHFPLAREIVAYQKHRVKRLRRQGP